MAFGINREELICWKKRVSKGEIAFLTHFWQDDRFPNCTSVTKVGCSDLKKLVKWGQKYHLKKEWIHQKEKYPHFDLFGEIQLKVLKNEGLYNHIQRFRLEEKIQVHK